MHSIFEEVSLVLLMATVFAVAVRTFRLPPLVGYILTGMVLGPIGMRLVHNNDLFQVMREIGTALLLFFVGLEIDWQKTKHIVRTVWQIGAIQIICSFVFSYILIRLVGLSVNSAPFLGLALASSSTVIIIKLLSEYRDLNTLHGHLSTGILLFQDLVTIVALVILAGTGTASTLAWPSLLTLLLVKSASLLIVTWFLSRYILPYIFDYLAHSPELLFVASLSWCFLLASILKLLDLPLEIGAFLAGLSLATLPYSLDIASRLRPVRDFFVILLFVTIGSSFALPSFGMVALSLVLLGFVLVVKPLITIATLELHGYKSRVAFFTAITQNQLSEFSLLIIALAQSHNLVSAELTNVITGVAVVSILCSTIIIGYRRPLYKLARPFIHILERKSSRLLPVLEEPPTYTDHVIIFGYHRMGCHIFRKMRHSSANEIVIVDMNPDIIRTIQGVHNHCVYGDIQDEDVLAQASADKARVVISTIPHRDDTEFLIRYLRHANPEAIVIVTAHYVEDALDYYDLGADYVILPHLLGGEHIGELLSRKPSELRSTLHQLAKPVIRLHPTSAEPFFD